MSISNACRDVIAERQRQIEKEGWKPEYDDEHSDGSLAMAAVSYALPVTERGTKEVAHHHEWSGCARYDDSAWTPVGSAAVPIPWPWDGQYWKPGDRRRELVKAGALILAEIERLDRADKNVAKDDV